jgi:hypothetical protein
MDGAGRAFAIMRQVGPGCALLIRATGMRNCSIRSGARSIDGGPRWPGKDSDCIQDGAAHVCDPAVRWSRMRCAYPGYRYAELLDCLRRNPGCALLIRATVCGARVRPWLYLGHFFRPHPGSGVDRVLALLLEPPYGMMVQPGGAGCSSTAGPRGKRQVGTVRPAHAHHLERILKPCAELLQLSPSAMSPRS